MQGVADLGAGEADADMSGSDMFDRMRFIKDNKVVLKENATLGLFVHASPMDEERCMVQDQDICRSDATAGTLKETNSVLLRELRAMSAQRGGTQAAFGTDLLPNVGFGFDLKIGKAAILGFQRPFVDALEFWN